MKKINWRLVTAIVWILVALQFFYINKIGVGLCWLLVGIINLKSAIKTHQMNKKIRAVSKHLEETVHWEIEEDEGDQNKTVIETIKLSKEEHVISDEYIGYEYVINKAFKPVKSHSAEVDLICTYSPNNEDGNIPYVAVQIDDMVYCAVEEYKESGTFEGALSIEPLEGKFMFKAKREYYGDMMYFYGFELEGDEYWDKAGLCLVYSKEYIGNEEEEKLMNILDEAAKSFNKITKETRMNVVEFLKKEIEDTNNLDELILTFEKMCEIPIQEEKEKEILFETGTYSFTGKSMFVVSLVRQYPNEEEEYCQIHMDIMFNPTEENSSFRQTIWNFELEESIFDYVRNSQEYKVLKDASIAKIDVYKDET